MDGRCHTDGCYRSSPGWSSPAGCSMQACCDAEHMSRCRKHAAVACLDRLWALDDAEVFRQGSAVQHSIRVGACRAAAGNGAS
jgi:hypothetical protein